MSLYSYQVLETVIEQGSFVKAAESLGLTPSAISHIISNLEDEYDVKLLLRGRRGVSLTSAGEKLMPFIREICQDDVRLKQEVDKLHGVDSGIVRIGAFSSVNQNWVPGMLNLFQQEYPNINVQLYQGGYDDIIRWMETLKLDIGFMSETVLSDFKVSDDVKFIPLYDDPIVCVAASDALPEYTDSVTLNAIKKENFIMAMTGYDQDARHLLKRYKLNVPTSYHIQDDGSILAMVEAGLGITLMAEMIAENCHRDIRILPLEPAEHRTIGLLVREDALPVAERLKQIICRYLEQEKIYI